MTEIVYAGGTRPDTFPERVWATLYFRRVYCAGDPERLYPMITPAVFYHDESGNCSKLFFPVQMTSQQWVRLEKVLTRMGNERRPIPRWAVSTYGNFQEIVSRWPDGQRAYKDDRDRVTSWNRDKSKETPHGGYKTCGQEFDHQPNFEALKMINPGRAGDIQKAGVAIAISTRHHMMASRTWGFKATTVSPGFDQFDLRLMSWGDGSGVPTSGKNLVVVGIDSKGLLHIRIYDTARNRIADTDETKLPAQAAAIATLKQQLPSLLPPHELTDAEKAQVISEATSIVGQAHNWAGPKWVKGEKEPGRWWGSEFKGNVTSTTDHNANHPAAGLFLDHMHLLGFKSDPKTARDPSRPHSRLRIEMVGGFINLYVVQANSDPSHIYWEHEAALNIYLARAVATDDGVDRTDTNLARAVATDDDIDTTDTDT